MTLIRSICFNLVFFGTAPFIVSVLLVVTPLPRRFTHEGIRNWMSFLLWLAKVLARLDYEIRGRENLPAAPVVIAAKHQSAWDTAAFFHELDDAAFIIKKELLAIPVYGWLLRRDRMIAIDREGGSDALKKMVRDTRAALAAGRQVVIFPEGTRGEPGERLPYHPGVAALYAMTGVPVVPVAVNSGLFWGRRSFLKHPGTITIEYLEPMPLGMKRHAFMAELERRIETASENLMAHPTTAPAEE